MDSIHKIRFVLLSMLFLIFNQIILPISAKTYSIEPKGNKTLSEESFEIFSEITSKSEVLWGEIADVDIEALMGADTLNVIVENYHVELLSKYQNQDIDYHYVHYESLDNEAQAYVSILDGYVHVDLRTTIGYYQIISISSDEIAIVKYEPMIIDEEEYIGLSDNDNTGREEDIETMSVVPKSTPTIRVLFLYTSSALAMMNSPQLLNMKMEAFRYINEANLSFVNSNVNAHLQLAYLGPVNYNENSYTWNQVLNHFSTQGDGYIDEVHSLRNKYSADICVLMLDKEDYCGEAYAINATASGAFCMIWPSFNYCGYRFSAIHEIGHLIGCRHNRKKDNSNTPYKYGHGFMNCDTITSALSWCTIMSYETSCSGYCPRILNWSNPYITYNGIATGTTTYENNSRVWNERASTVASFRSRNNSLIYIYSDNNTQALYESIEATSNITAGGGFEVQSGQTVEMYASNEIRFMANTHIKNGAKFRATTQIDNSTYPQFIKRKETAPNIVVEDIFDKNSPARKILRDGQVLIERNGRTYTATGAEVR